MLYWYCMHASQVLSTELSILSCHRYCQYNVTDPDVDMTCSFSSLLALPHYPAHHLTFCVQPVRSDVRGWGQWPVQCLRPSSWHRIMECGAERVSAQPHCWCPSSAASSASGERILLSLSSENLRTELVHCLTSWWHAKSVLESVPRLGWWLVRCDCEMLKQLHHPTDLLFFRILNEEAKNSDFIDFGGARSPQEGGYRV